MRKLLIGDWHGDLVLHVVVGDGEVGLHVEGDNTVETAGEGNTGGR